ncbi:signal recognition particle-docking protein FtsY [Rhizobium sp.]
MALSFIKRVFSFGKDDKSTAAPEVAPSPVVDAPVAEPAPEIPAIDPVTAEHLGDRLIVPDSLHPDDLDETAVDPVEELREQTESVAEFNEAVEEEIVAPVVPPDEPGIDGRPDEVIEAAEPESPVEPAADTALIMDAEPVVEPAETVDPDPKDDVIQAPDSVLTQVAEQAADPDLAEDSKTEAPEVLEASPEPAAATDAPRAAPVLPAGFSSSADRIAPEQVTPERKLSWIERLRQGLSRTSAQLTSQITALFTKRKLDDDTLQDLEDLLIQADLGVETALRITDTLASERYGKDVSGEDVSKIMASEITKVLAPVAKPLELDLSHKPHVILVVGVNGTGKTTTIGKLAAKLTRSGLKVMLAAGDTFRAAAIEQLKIWASRTGADIVSSKLGADAAGLAYEAYEKAKQSGHDVLIIDTAGRLQNKTELMAELEKIVRVLGRLDPDAPHTVLQTLDATTGQNALNQVEIFRNVAGVSGLIMTKLDGTARGGILVAISAKHKLPVCFIGVGEGIEDLEPFNAQDFAEAIAGIQNK